MLLTARRRRPITLIAEGSIFLVSQTAIAVILLIFLFVAREAFPIFTGSLSSAAIPAGPPIDPNAIDTLKPEEIRRYLGLSESEFTSLDRSSILEILTVRREAYAAAGGDPDASHNTLNWKYLFAPHQWSDYTQPVYIWQPVSQIHKYNVVPLLVGTLKIALVALLLAVPVALGSAIHVSQLASARTKRWIKPAVELLSSVPSVVLGAFAAVVLASALQSMLGYTYRLNAFLAGLALAIACIPVIFSIAEDALSFVPRTYTDAAIALGATRWQATTGIVVPAAAQGLAAAVILGFGRCLGETMVVLIASGNAALLSSSLFDPARTLTATIAAELGETVIGGHHYRMLFFIGTLLLLISFLTHAAAYWVLSRLRMRFEGAP
jgi:phosphate transport system permease protein